MAANSKRDVVVDASFVLAFLIPDERHSKVDQYFSQFKAGFLNFITSSLFPFEVVNGLLVALRRERINRNYCQARLKELLDYEIEIKDVDFMEIFLLADKLNLTSYDASYLYLARKYQAELLSLDRRLLKLV